MGAYCLLECPLLIIDCTTPIFNHIFFCFYFRVGENGPWDSHPEIHTNNSIASYHMTGLLPYTVYSFRIIAVNRLGKSLPSKESYYIVTLREGLYYNNSTQFVIFFPKYYHNCYFSHAQNSTEKRRKITQNKFPQCSVFFPFLCFFFNEFSGYKIFYHTLKNHKY